MNALGFYLLVSLSFVLVTMIEFAIVMFIKRKSDLSKVSTCVTPVLKEGDKDCTSSSNASRKKDTWFVK